MARIKIVEPEKKCLTRREKFIKKYGKKGKIEIKEKVK